MNFYSWENKTHRKNTVLPVASSARHSWDIATTEPPFLEHGERHTPRGCEERDVEALEPRNELGVWISAFRVEGHADRMGTKFGDGPGRKWRVHDPRI